VAAAQGVASACVFAYIYIYTKKTKKNYMRGVRPKLTAACMDNLEATPLSLLYCLVTTKTSHAHTRTHTHIHTHASAPKSTYTHVISFSLFPPPNDCERQTRLIHECASA